MEENTPTHTPETAEDTETSSVHPSTKTELTIPKAIVLAALIMGLSWIAVTALSAPKIAECPPTDNSTPCLIKNILATKNDVHPDEVNERDHARGAADPKVTIIEYSDFECPFCKVFNGTLDQLLEKYGDSLSVVYRHYPLDCKDNGTASCTPLHLKARQEAIASECAAAQGGNDAFWKWNDRIFAVTPSNDGLDPALLPKIAQDIGLDVSAFNTCLKDPVYAEMVSADATEGLKNVKIQGTPTSVIIDNKTGTTYRIAGAYPYDVVEGIIEKILK